MTNVGTGAGFSLELLGAPEAFVQTALLAGGVGLWEWPVASDRMSLSPYLETLLGYPADGFDGTKTTFLGRIKPIDRARFQSALAAAVEQGAECDAEFRIDDIHGSFR